MRRPEIPLRRLVLATLGCAMLVGVAAAGVSRQIQDRYRRKWENRALFLRFPVYGERQYVYISGNNYRVEQPAGTAPLRLKVGDQVRITELGFGGDDIKFKISAIQGAATAEIVYKFDASLQDDFPNSDVFDNALEGTFTEGLRFTDIEEAKRQFVEEQFDLSVRQIVQSGGTTRETVLKAIAPQLPAYQDAVKDIDNLKSRNQELSGQLSRSQSEARRLESDLRAQQADNTRLKSQVGSLQDKIESSTGQLARIGDELRNARGQTQGYQREIASLQRSLNIRVDPSRELAAQIGDLGAAIRKLQKDNEDLESRAASLKTSLEASQARAQKLTSDLDDLKASAARDRETIATLTSKEDSLARQYIQLRQVKDNLDVLARSVEALRARTLEEASRDGFRSLKAELSLRSTPLGTIELRIPVAIAAGAEASATAAFSSESIDYVKLGPEERTLLRSLGDKLKVQLRLSSQLETLEVRPDPDEPLHELGERDRAEWRWRVANRGQGDGWLRFEVQLINRNKETISVFESDQHVMSSNVVRQVRSYLQPVPLATGTVFGMVLFAIGRFFFRPHKPRTPRGGAPAAPAPHHGPKQL